MDNNKIGRHIIDSNHFMSIATSHNDDVWIAPTFFANDKKYHNLYFVSSLSSKHCQDILVNNRVAVSIFDSNQKEGIANGIQIMGHGMQVEKSMYPEIIMMFGEKAGKVITLKLIEDKIKEYETNNRAIFQIKIIDAYIQDTDCFEKHRVDKRIRVNL